MLHVDTSNQLHRWTVTHVPDKCAITWSRSWIATRLEQCDCLHVSQWLARVSRCGTMQKGGDHVVDIHFQLLSRIDLVSKVNEGRWPRQHLRPYCCVVMGKLEFTTFTLSDSAAEEYLDGYRYHDTFESSEFSHQTYLSPNTEVPWLEMHSFVLGLTRSHWFRNTRSSFVHAAYWSIHVRSI